MPVRSLERDRLLPIMSAAYARRESVDRAASRKSGCSVFALNHPLNEPGCVPQSPASKRHFFVSLIRRLRVAALSMPPTARFGRLGRPRPSGAGRSGLPGWRLRAPAFRQSAGRRGVAELVEIQDVPRARRSARSPISDARLAAMSGEVSPRVRPSEWAGSGRGGPAGQSNRRSRRIPSVRAAVVKKSASNTPRTRIPAPRGCPPSHACPRTSRLSTIVTP